VVCVKNGAETIEQLLVSLKKTCVTELIIVDGMSTDRTLEICRKYTDNILSDEGGGLALARQIGAEAATGDIIAYVDADVKLLSDNLFQIMLTEMNESNWVAINPQIIDLREKKNLWEDAQDTYYRETSNLFGKKRYLIGMVFMVRRDLVLNYPFDPAFTFGSEDTDFFHRLGKDGYEFGVSTGAIFHFHRSSLKELARQKMGYGGGEIKFIMKHGTYRNLTTPIYIFLTGIPRSLKAGRPSHMIFYFLWGLFLKLGMLKGMIDYCRNPVFKRKK